MSRPKRKRHKKIVYVKQANHETCSRCGDPLVWKTPFGFYLCKKHDDELAEGFNERMKMRSDIDVEY